ncbi:MAG: hypothetical protein M1827_000203 [Pycnora praestabilis]|nr:MAG: hypothetical protein M1827_000203 [Pycnora praestabilis]
MACPLSAILNNETQDLPLQRPKISTSNIQPDEKVWSPRDSQTDPSHDSLSTRAIGYGTLPPFTFSSTRGNLYARRARRSPIRVEALPNRDLLLRSNHYDDEDPPTHELDFDDFNIFQAILGQPELTLNFARHLDLEDLISLYAISKDFHALVNSRFTTTILSQSLNEAPESSRTFLFKGYKSLCIMDPIGRPNPEVQDKVRMVPSFRWLRMILYREKVVDDIVLSMAAEGHRLPPRATLALKKVWLTMDIATNAARIGLLHNKELWTDRDIDIATLVFLKLDMRFTDPVDGDGETCLRKMFLAQRSLTPLWEALKRTGTLTQLEMLQMYVRWKYRPSPANHNLSILGVPADEIGAGEREGWGRGTARLMRPDELIMREGVRRGLDLQKRYLDIMIAGFIDTRTFQDFPIPSMPPADDEANFSTSRSICGRGNSKSTQHKEKRWNGLARGERIG